MSDDLLAAAAAALGAPAEIVMRSAQARAEAEGSTVDEILAAWAGGTPPPTTTTETPPADVDDQEPHEAEASAAGEPTPAPEPAVSVPTAPTPTAPVLVHRAIPIYEMDAPVLEGRKERPMALLLGALALFLAGVLGAVIFPAIAEADTDVIVLRSELAEAGRTVYLQEGCGYCHTQLVRPIVTDVNLGPVTEASDFGSEYPATQGVMRVGPDLAHVGSRPIAEDAATLREFLLGDGEFQHQSSRYLTDADLAALVAYLQSLVD